MGVIEENIIIFLNNCLRESHTLGEVYEVHEIAKSCQSFLRKKGFKSVLKYEGLIEGYCVEYR